MVFENVNNLPLHHTTCTMIQSQYIFVRVLKITLDLGLLESLQLPILFPMNLYLTINF